MRRKDRMMEDKGIERVLREGEYGFLGTESDGKPYITPLSYIFMEDAVYFHAAREGKKLDNIQSNSQVSFCVVGRTEPVFLKGYTTYYESVILSGKAYEVADEEERSKVLYQMVEKYLPSHREAFDQEMSRTGKATVIYRIEIEEITGKENKKKD